MTKTATRLNSRWRTGGSREIRYPADDPNKELLSRLGPTEFFAKGARIKKRGA